MTVSALDTFLKDRRVRVEDKREPFTHTSREPAACYYIEDDDLPEFWKLFNDAVARKERRTEEEKPEQYGPYRIDVDLRASSSHSDQFSRLYNEKLVRKIIRKCQEEIKKIVDPRHFDEKIIRACFFQKPAARVDKGLIHDGFHIIFPFFHCEAWVQDDYLRNILVEWITAKRIWQDFPISEPAEKIIDVRMARKLWHLYGSSKSKKSQGYILTHVYGDNAKAMTLGEMFEEEMIGRDSTKKTNYYLPQFLSVRGHDVPTPLNNTTEFNQMKAKYTSKKIVRIPVKRVRSEKEVLEDLKVLKDGGIMDMLSDDRADYYPDWMDVGWTLFNISQGDTLNIDIRGLDMWIDFSQRSEKFIEGECEEIWTGMEMKGKSIGSIFAMAKKDSPDAYEKWKSSNIQVRVKKSLAEPKPNEYDVARVFEKMYEGRFICANSTKNLWYEFKNHRWNRVDDANAIKALLPTEVVAMYYKYRTSLAKEIEDEEEDDEKKKIEAKISKCANMITALKTGSFQRKVVEQCKNLPTMYDSEFMKKIDENRKLLGLPNGVMDLELCTVREGRPDDYITLCTNIPFQAFDHKDEYMIKLNTFLRHVFPNINRRRYFIRFMCSCLEGGNVNKKFLICTGGGNNSKSTVMNMIETMLGEYCFKFPRNMFIQGAKDSGFGPKPELSRAKGKRVCIGQEVTETETFNIGFIKEVTGGDSFYSRTHFDEGSEQRPMFTLIMQCNDPPKVPLHDDATWGRIRILAFESKFSNDAPESLDDQEKQNHFAMDPQIRETIRELAPAMLYLLFQEYKDYKTEGLSEPSEVKMSTNQYKNMNDVYAQFISEKLEKVEDSTVFIKLTDVCEEFKEWFGDNYASYKKDKIGKVKIRHELEKRIGSIGAKSRWFGYKFVIPDNDDDEVPEDEKADDFIEKSEDVDE